MDINIIFFTNTNESYRTVTIRKSQVTVDRLALVFKLMPTTIYISEEFGPSDFPNGNGRFEGIEDVDDGTRFEVFGQPTEDEPLPSTSLSTQEIGAFRRFSRSSLPGSLSFTPTSSVKRRKSEMNAFSLKIILGRINASGKKIEQIRQQYFNVNPENANVEQITAMAEIGFGTGPLVLVQANCLAIEDSEITRDQAFWKTSARKIFALTKEEVEQRSSIHQPLTRADRSVCDAITDISRKIDEINNNVVQRSIIIPEAVNLDRAFRSIRLIDPLMAALRCIICHGVSSSPMSISTCCKQLLGCGSCISQWTDNRCPHCRSDQYSSIEINTFEGVSTELANL